MLISYPNQFVLGVQFLGPQYCRIASKTKRKSLQLVGLDSEANVLFDSRKSLVPLRMFMVLHIGEIPQFLMQEYIQICFTLNHVLKSTTYEWHFNSVFN